MPKIALVLLLGAAVAATCVLLMWQTGGSTLFGGKTEREEAEEIRGNDLTAPRLDAGPTAPRTRAPQGRPDEEPRASTGKDVILTVHVVDDETGGPIARAALAIENARTPCPRLPPLQAFDSTAGPMQQFDPPRTDAEGVLRLTAETSPTENKQPLDVSAQAQGYVIGMACAVAVPGEVTLRLRKGLVLRGRVVDPKGKALENAMLMASPFGATPHVPGHSGHAVTDERGRFAIDGLLPGPLRVEVHMFTGFLPTAVDGEDPKDDRERTYVLQPAFTFKFRLRTNDGREIVNPTVEAKAPLAQPPFQHLKIVKLLDDKNADGQLTEGVMVPASLGTVALELKAEGYAPWRSPAEPVPPEGGERILPVTLDRDAGQGGLRITFEDERGKRLKYVELRALPPLVMALERQDLGGGIVFEQGEDLRFPSLPPGKYRLGVRAFAYAPDTFDTVVVGGTESEHRVAFRLAARLRVKFTAPAARMVRFRILQNGRPVPALPEEGETKPTDAPPGDEPVLSAGEAGALLGGLASGTYVVEVISEDLQPTRTPVTVREGETEEIDIRVTPK